MSVLSALLVLLLVETPAPAQIIVDYADPPAATEAELFSKVPVVVRGRVEARKMEHDAGPITSVYSVRILELLKDDGRHSAGELMDVHRHGGFDAKTMDREFRLFELNDEVVLFLQRGNNGWYWPLNGPDGAFRLTEDGRTDAFGRLGEVSKRHAGRPASDFIAELRKHKK